MNKHLSGQAQDSSLRCILGQLSCSRAARNSFVVDLCLWSSGGYRNGKNDCVCCVYSLVVISSLICLVLMDRLLLVEKI